MPEYIFILSLIYIFRSQIRFIFKYISIESWLIPFNFTGIVPSMR